MMREADKPSDRRQDIIHPSEMAKKGWCPLGTYLRIKACREANNPYLKPKEYIGVQLLNIFDEGHYIHDKWQKRLWNMGELWGNWFCNHCGIRMTHQLAPEDCPQCSLGKVSLEYREIPLRAPEYLIAGHADGGVPSKNALIEIKSVGAGTVRVSNPELYKKYSEGQKVDLPGLWKGIEEPFPDHVNQGQIYLRICEIMGLEYSRISFLYESKFNQGAKEFVVNYDKKHTDDLFESARQISRALEGLTDPPECPHNGCTDCEGTDYGTTLPERLGSGRSSDSERSENSGPTRVIRRTGTTRRIVRGK
ncbi:exonuclease [Streptomyces phage BRock]|uniref:Uncharacterized protein n=1 Tax=Streptomyces phage BRock TaxID=1913591 RepID=A0A1J0GVW6_9CAUD|nr:exonuclease [Streptomyces phage BRock]APC46329.1 hypothetical protein [Streptomyces phage BRock]